MKYNEIIMKDIFAYRLEKLDLLSLSQILYSFYRISEKVDLLGLHIPDIQRLFNAFQRQLSKISGFYNNENKAITTVVIFLREFLYDDQRFIAALCRVSIL